MLGCFIFPFFLVFNWMVSVEKEYAMGAEGALAD